MVVTGWRGVALLVVGLAVLALLVALVVWVAIALGVLASVVWLNLMLLPRISRRLHVPGLALELSCLPVLGGAGWLLGGLAGAGLGTVAWLAGIGVPRLLVGRRLRARVRSVTHDPGTVIVLEGPALGEPTGPGSNTTE